MSPPDSLTRRGFIRTATLAALSGTLAGRDTLGVLAPPVSAAAKSRVVLLRDLSVLDADGRVRPAVIQSMLDAAVTTLTGAKDASAAWRALVRPDDVVGIKSNKWPYLPTPPALELAIQTRVLGAGVARADVAIDDQGVLRSPVFRRATALINTRPMRTHHWAGVGTLIKNYIMFAPDPPSYHPDSCADLATIWNLPVVRGKTRLNVLVLLTPQFHGVGPHSFSPQYVWRYYGLAVGTDPVAVDSVGLRIIEAKRREYFRDDRPLNPPAKHIAIADTRHHLGTADPAGIDLVTLGDRQDALIDR